MFELIFISLDLFGLSYFLVILQELTDLNLDINKGLIIIFHTNNTENSEALEV